MQHKINIENLVYLKNCDNLGGGYTCKLSRTKRLTLNSTGFFHRVRLLMH